ncbi:MAG: DUF3800 domain-containing protein [Thomasclavelia ramosa]
MEYNIYCDESCHLPNDNSNIMVIGAISCPKNKAFFINHEIQNIKRKHGIFKFAEIKWTKVSQSKIEMYKELIDLFFEHNYLNFRCVIATNKHKLDPKRFNLTYNDWYYRIYYLALKEMLDISNSFNIYIDIKDTKGQAKIEKLQDVLNRTLYDFSDSTVKHIQEVKSDQVQILQITDLLIGAIGYSNRGLCTSDAKESLIDYVCEKAHRPLNYTSPKNELKFNIFKWAPRGYYNDL